MTKNYLLRLLIPIFALFVYQTHAQDQSATVRIDDNIKFQEITGFGGFVCSPQFAYDYMSTDEIETLWGAESELKYNIMRLYIPIGRESWSQSLATAQLAQSLGLIIFASPWSMPAEWKTNNDIAGVVTRDGMEIEGFLKEENYEDYANYLNDYVTYLRDNGVDLEGISLQNEPDFEVEYAGCSWTPEQISNFLINYGDLIDCKIITPETVGFNDTYSQRLSQDDVKDYIDIYAGHQYQNIGNDQELLREQGKELWMTEYLINWNAGNTDRDYVWEIDAFDFAAKLNDAMQANVSAWVHYASKRYYGMMGDGINGTIDGEITKRGYILSHYSKYTIGTTRIQTTWNDDSQMLKGTSYLSEDGENVTIQISNPSENVYELTADLPFYTTSGTMVTTTENQSMVSTPISLDEEDFRPRINLAASSFTTLVFTKSSERPESQMTGSSVHYNVIENQTVTDASFGTAYELSNSTATFEVNTPLISPNTTVANGYLELDDRYNELVFHVESVSSANQYNTDNTTLNYINDDGTLSSYNYGRIDLPRAGNFDIRFDISPSVLIDGCRGIVSISNSNYSSVLTLEFGDVYFRLGDENAYQFSGIYSVADSDLLNSLDDVNNTSIDFTATSGIDSEQDWHADAANTNGIFYVADDITNTNSNVISGTTSETLELSAAGGDFYVPFDFSAETASLESTLEGSKMIILPFEA
ncbi:MAG: secretion protein, partial [Leeuwenhoekiella sp.]